MKETPGTSSNIQKDGGTVSPFQSAQHGFTVERRIYILGSGGVGKLVAHSLAGIPNRPPITLLFHRQRELTEWKSVGERIELITYGKSESRSDFQVELALPDDRTTQSQMDQEATIHNLIVSVKAPNTFKALQAIARRLTRDSTILFLQNGMGTIERINSELFPDLESRPNYMMGVVTHGLSGIKRFTVDHTGQGTVALGLIPRHPPQSPTTEGSYRKTKESFAPSSRYLLRTLTRTPVLAAVGFAPTDLLQIQIEKLAMNAIINPLSVVFDCRNGELLHNFAITRVMRLLLSEISFVIRSLPELQGVPNVNVRFAPARLEALVVSIATTTASNYSSMLQDIRLGKQTEIDYINGYIVRRGEDMGFKCIMNYMLLQMVAGKWRMVAKQESKSIPTY